MTATGDLADADVPARRVAVQNCTITAADLPRLLVLSDRAACGARRLADVVRAAVDGGARALVLREKDLPTPERARLADELRAVLAPVSGLLVLAGPELAGAGLAARRLPDEAVHLAAADPLPAVRPWLLGRSCHDAGEVRRAAAEGCDWVTLSPVFFTASKPGYGPALGAEGLRALTAGAPPSYALGGVEPQRVRECLDAGAYGVAVMGAVMRAARPDRLVADLLAGLDPAPLPG
ncbi:MAG: thiamine phosphate synthase [Actinomycetota bacterium]|nr:thiamine phosphate synthase [Actinomycetota bacterium]